MNMPLPPSPEALVARRIRADVQAMHAYAVQDPQGMVKLDAMENPYRLSAELQSALGARLGAVALNRYPGVRLHDLRQALAQYAHMPAGYDIILGNGSDELISLLSLACAVGTDPSTGKPPVVLAPREHLNFVWLPWREAADRCFSPSNAEAVLHLPRLGGPAAT